MAANTRSAVHHIGPFALVRAALQSQELTAEHSFRASRLTMGPTILDIDGQKHSAGKKVLSKLFSPARIAEYRERIIAPAVRSAWHATEGLEVVDVIEAVAVPIPAEVIFGVLGLPSRGAADMYRSMMTPIIRFIGDNRTGYDAALAAHDELSAFVMAALNEPGAGSRVIDQIAAESLADGFTRSEAIGAVILTMLAGTETTTCALANLFVAMAEHPQSWRAVVEGRLGTRPFVEEVLRIEAPIHHTHRFVLSDTDALSPLSLKRGEALEICLQEANRSEERLVEAAHWQPCEGRGTGATFGLGRHACIGKALAICELEELAALLKHERFHAESITSRAPIGGLTFRRPAHVFVNRMATAGASSGDHAPIPQWSTKHVDK